MWFKSIAGNLSPSPLCTSENFPDKSPVPINTPGWGEAPHGAIYLPSDTQRNDPFKAKGFFNSQTSDQITRVNCSNKGVNDNVAIPTRKIVPLIALRSIATISRSKFRARAICQVYVALKDRYISIKAISLLQTTCKYSHELRQIRRSLGWANDSSQLGKP